MSFIHTATATVLFAVSLLPTGCHQTSTHPVADAVSDETGCANAIPVHFSNDTFEYEGEITGLSNAAYFSVPSIAAGNWLLVETLNDEVISPTFDPVVSILNAAGTRRLAAVDSMALWSSEDPHFHFHLADTQSLCIKIESFSGWTRSATPGTTPTTPLTYLLQLSLNPADGNFYDTETYTGSDTEISDSNTLRLVASETYEDVGFHWLHGVLDTAEDADVFSFITLNIETVTNVYVNAETGIGDPFSGRSGMGSTAEITIQLLDDEKNIIAEMSPDLLRPVLSLILAPNTLYHIRVTGAPGWIPGANNFYNLYLVSESAQAFSLESDTDNGSLSNATPVTLTADGDGFQRAIVIGHIESENDVDVFQISLTPGQIFMLQCLGASSGSGLRNLTVGAFNADGSRIQTDVETELPIEWSDGTNSTRGPLRAEAHEDLYLRISGEITSSPLSRFYQCYILVTDPESL